MQKEEEIKEALKRLVEDLCIPADSSMKICLPYWKARCLLRMVALNAYRDVTSRYIAQGNSLEFPSRGFKCIADDYNETMRSVEHDYMLHPAEELSDE